MCAFRDRTFWNGTGNGIWNVTFRGGVTCRERIVFVESRLKQGHDRGESLFGIIAFRFDHDRIPLESAQGQKIQNASAVGDITSFFDSNTRSELFRLLDQHAPNPQVDPTAV